MRTKLKKTSGHCSQAQAFTRLECLLCVVAVMLLVSVAVPSLASTRNRSQRAICVDNLRLIGQGMQLWGVDHDNQYSWQVNAFEGGTRPASGAKPAAAWYEFSFLSNQLVTPKILVCPSDTVRARNAADTWGNSTNGGYFNAKYRDNATSYAINVHCFLGDPKSPVCSDRNLRVDSLLSGACSLGFNNIYQILPFPTSIAAWTNAIHGLTGNILTAEGSVLQIPDSGLKPYLSSVLTEDNGAFHIIVP
jgi:competence protein ComGC